MLKAGQGVLAGLLLPPGFLWSPGLQPALERGLVGPREAMTRCGPARGPLGREGLTQQPLLCPAWFSDSETPRLSPSIPGEERLPWERLMVTGGSPSENWTEGRGGNWSELSCAHSPLTSLLIFLPPTSLLEEASLYEGTLLGLRVLHPRVSIPPAPGGLKGPGCWRRRHRTAGGSAVFPPHVV